MKRSRLQRSIWIMAWLCVACGMVQKKPDPWNLYTLHPVAVTPSGQVIPADNDAYYTRPGSYSCDTITAMPSCVGR